MIDKVLAAIARDHHGIIPTNAIRSAGIPRSQIRKRLADGQLVRVHEKVIAIAGAPRTWEFRASAALAALPKAVLGMQSAAKVHDIWVPNWDDPITLCGPLEAHHQLDGIRVRRTGRLPDWHMTVVSGFRVTTRARTLVDLAAIVNDARLQRLVEDELVGGRTSWTTIEDTFLSLAKRGRKGIARMRRVLDRLEGSPPTESALERRFVGLLERHGLEASVQAVAPWADREPGRVDLLFPFAHLIVELDGRRFHARSLAFESDRRRDQLALVRGYRTVRFTHKQVFNDEPHVVETMRALLSERIPS